MTALAVVLARKRRLELPFSLFEPLALLLLGYHALFTVWVLPWHFTTALCLCLLAASPRGLYAGLLVTASCILFHVNERWVWTYPWQDPRWISWILGISQQTGPILAMLVLLRGMWTESRVPAHTSAAALRRTPGSA